MSAVLGVEAEIAQRIADPLPGLVAIPSVRRRRLRRTGGSDPSVIVDALSGLPGGALVLSRGPQAAAGSGYIVRVAALLGVRTMRLPDDPVAATAMAAHIARLIDHGATPDGRAVQSACSRGRAEAGAVMRPDLRIRIDAARWTECGWCASGGEPGGRCPGCGGRIPGGQP